MKIIRRQRDTILGKIQITPVSLQSSYLRKEGQVNQSHQFVFRQKSCSLIESSAHKITLHILFVATYTEIITNHAKPPHHTTAHRKPWLHSANADKLHGYMAWLTCYVTINK